MSFVVFILVIAQAAFGISQPTLIRSLVEDRITCSNETVSYTCTGSGIQMQWIAEPFINQTGFTLFINNDPRTVGSDFVRGPITAIHTATDPFITVLFMNGSLIPSDTMVICVDANGMNSSATFIAESKNVIEVSEMDVEPMVADFSKGSIMVTFEQSPSRDIMYCIVNCTGNTCQQVIIDAIETTAVIEANADIDGVSHNVSVCCVNRCGMESPMKSQVMELKTVESYSATVILFPFAMVAFLAVTTALVGYCIYVNKVR